MIKEKAQMLFLQYKDKVPSDQVTTLKAALENAPDEKFDEIACVPIKSSTTTLLFSIFLGNLGVDRFYIGDIGLGIGKLICGLLTLELWPFIDIFFSYRAAKKKNLTYILLATK